MLGPYGYRAFGLIANASMSGWADLSPDLWASMGVQDWYDLPVGPQSNFAGFGQKGAYLDPETQLYLMGSGGGSARYYDPVTGRFISEDRIGLAGGDPNLFRYCGNDPVNKKDPGGADLQDDRVMRSYRGMKGDVTGTYNVGVQEDAGRRDAPLLLFTPDPPRDATSDATFYSAVQATLNDPVTPGVITQDEVNAIAMDEGQAIRILAATGRYIDTPYSTKAYIDYAESHFGKDWGWSKFRKKYPGLNDFQVVLHETRDANILRAKAALTVDTNPAIQGFMKVFAPTATLIMMSMDLPMMVGSAFRPAISSATMLGEGDLESVLAEAKAKQWAVDYHISEEFDGVLSSLSTEGGLAAHESDPASAVVGGHTLDPAKAHVGATDPDLANRAVAEAARAAARGRRRLQLSQRTPTVRLRRRRFSICYMRSEGKFRLGSREQAPGRER